MHLHDKKQQQQQQMSDIVCDKANIGLAAFHRNFMK